MENDKELLPNFCEQGLPEPPNEIVQNIGKINGTELQKVYTKEGFLGRGGFAQCHITYNKETDKRVATKIIPKTLLQAARTKLRLVNEIKLHNTLHHPNIVEFLTNFQDENYVYINLQLCESGSLCDLTQVRCDLTTPEVQSILYGLCQGLAYLHSRNIIHRDLKAGNIFLDEKNRVKIGDFGLATKLEFNDERKRTICGTPNYIAPEVLFGKGYHFQVDIWSIGVLIYTLYFTIPPFQTQDAYTTYQKIKRCDYIFPKYHDAPPEALDLIKKILVVNPAERITIEGILNHPFFKLGNGILDGLPDCIIKRPPNKKQISKWPKVVQVELPVKKAEPFEQAINENTQMKSSFQNSLLYYPHEVSAVGNEKCYAMLFEEINPNIYFFCLNNANYGILVKDKSYIFESNFIQDQKNPGERRIKQMRINHSRKSEGLINGMLLSECEHRVLLSLKFKQISRLNLKFDAHLSTGIHISMFSQRKDLNILKFTNKYLQMILENNDGFVYQGQLHYCPSFSSSRDFYQINMEALMVAPGKENERAQPIPENIFSNPKYKKNPTLTCKKIAYASKFVQEVCLRKMARQI